MTRAGIFAVDSPGDVLGLVVDVAVTLAVPDQDSGALIREIRRLHPALTMAG